MAAAITVALIFPGQGELTARADGITRAVGKEPDLRDRERTAIGARFNGVCSGGTAKKCVFLTESVWNRHKIPPGYHHTKFYVEIPDDIIVIS